MQLLVKDFAQDMGCSQSIIYRHIRNHAEELGDMVIKESKRTWITDKGQEFIRKLMVQQPIVINDSTVSADLEQLKRENSDLKDKLIIALESLDRAHQLIENDLSQKIELEAARSEALQAATDCNQYRERAEQAEQEAAAQRQRAEDAEHKIQEIIEKMNRPLSFLERLTGKRKS